MKKIILKNKLLCNATWLIVCKIVQAILSFLVGILTTRYLGPSNYGIINYAISLVTFLVPIVQLGIRHILVQEFINNPEEEEKIVGTTLGLVSISSFLGIILMIIFVLIANYGSKDIIIVCSLYSVSLLFQSLELIQYWFQAKLMSKYIAIISLGAYVVISVYRIFLLISGKNVYWFALAHTLDYFIIAVALLVIFKKITKKNLIFSLSTAKRLLSKSKYYIVSGVMVCLFSQTDHIMLTNMLGEKENGIYSAALNCANLAGFIFSAVIDSFRPIIFESKKNNELSFEKNISRLYSIIIYASLLQSIFMIILSRYIILFLYGSLYEESISVLKIIVWYPMFSYLGTIRNIWILSENKQSIMWIINTSGAVLNIIGNYFLIPIYGASGAAFASVITQMFTNYILNYILVPLRRNNRLLLNGLNLKNIVNDIKNILYKK